MRTVVPFTGCITGIVFGLAAKAIQKWLWLPCAMEETIFGATSCILMDEYSLMIHVSSIMALVCFAIALGSLGLSVMLEEKQ